MKKIKDFLCDMVLSLLRFILFTFTASTFFASVSFAATVPIVKSDGYGGASFFDAVKNRSAMEACPYALYGIGKDVETSISPEEVVAMIGAFGPWNDLNKVIQKLPESVTRRAEDPLPFTGKTEIGPLEFFPADKLTNGLRVFGRIKNATFVVSGNEKAKEGDTKWPYPIVRETAVLVEFEKATDRDAWADMAGHTFSKIYSPAEFNQHPAFRYVEVGTERPLAALKAIVKRDGCDSRYALLFIMRRC